jgi:zinc transporter ZupT
VPVAINSFVDGFLMGVTCSLSRKAALILSFANCLEMAFLGMAVAMRVTKCTGSSAFVRNMAITVPPLIMWGSAVSGYLIGSSTREDPILFVAFVGFGVIALVFLVVNELFVSAREAMGDKETWWVTALIFFGMYVELSLSRLIK